MVEPLFLLIYLSGQSYKNLNGITFKNSSWKNNLAKFSTAVDVSPNIYDSIAGEFPLHTVFKDCNFIGNKKQ